MIKISTHIQLNVLIQQIFYYLFIYFYGEKLKLGIQILLWNSKLCFILKTLPNMNPFNLAP